MASLESLSHPAGVELCPRSLTAESRVALDTINSIRDGSYCADLIGQLPDVVRPDDRVLIVGAGLGVISTLVARMPGVQRVIAVEPNVTLIPHLEKVHEVNGAARVEIINAVPGSGAKGRVPFFARRDLRASSMMPHDGPWELTMLVPAIDLGLVIAEERISLIICERALAPEGLTDLEGCHAVRRVLLSDDTAAGQPRTGGGLGPRLVANLQ